VTQRDTDIEGCGRSNENGRRRQATPVGGLLGVFVDLNKGDEALASLNAMRELDPASLQIKKVVSQLSGTGSFGASSTLLGVFVALGNTRTQLAEHDTPAQVHRR
jgi:hypothetical protein